MNTEKNYKEIDFSLGGSIETAINLLKSYNDKGELACGSFNGKLLFSDIDDLDSAYKKITGKTKAEFDTAQKNEHDEYLENERKHKEAIPKLTKEWIEKGNAILDKKYHELWAKCVPIRLDDLYQGMELGACLEIVKPLNEGCSFEEAKTIIEKQGHSGMSYNLVKAMVKSLCDRGEEFVSYLGK
jgi:hypothetical protein